MYHFPFSGYYISELENAMQKHFDDDIITEVLNYLRKEGSYRDGDIFMEKGHWEVTFID
jgi:hypothetical protein